MSLYLHCLPVKVISINLLVYFFGNQHLNYSHSNLYNFTKEYPSKSIGHLNSTVDFDPQKLIMKPVSFLTLLALAVTIASSLNPGQIVYKANLTGPFNSVVNAFGNFDIQQPIWDEDRDELQQAQTAINNMVNYYGRSQFQRGPTYSLEYYRDSSINTVAYILYKLNGTQITKYYYLRAEFGPTKDTPYYLGSETTAGARPGHEMPLLRYTQVSKDNTTFINYVLGQVSTSSKIVYSPSAVLQVKYWSFPLGNLFLLRCQNTNKSSTYFGLVNTSSTLTYLGHTFVPSYISSLDLDYQYVNTYIKRFIFYIYGPIQFRTQGSMTFVVFFELFFDPMYKDGVHVMVTLNQRYPSSNTPFNFTRFMGMLWNYVGSGDVLVRQTIDRKAIVLDEFNYTSATQNRFHNQSYFNNNDYDQRIGYGWIDPAQEEKQKLDIGLSPRITNITDVYRVNYPNYRVHSLEIVLFNRVVSRYYTLKDRKGDYDIGRFSWTIYQSFLSYNSREIGYSTIKEEVKRTQGYIEEYQLLKLPKNYESLFTNLQDFCPVVDGQLQFGFTYNLQYDGRKCALQRSFFKDVPNNNIFYLAENLITQDDNDLTFFNTTTRRCQIKSVCPLITSQSMTSADMDAFYSQARLVLLDKNNQQITRTAINSVRVIRLAKLKLKDIWVVGCLVNGVTFTLVVTQDQKNQYVLLSYSQPESQNAPNSSGAGGSTNVPAGTNSGAGNVPLIGGAAPSAIPNYSLQGNGDLSKSEIDPLYPSLLSLIKQNNPNSCLDIAAVRYYIDPLSKIIAFMLSCSEASGYSVYELVTITASKQLFYMGKKSLLIVPDNYWQMKPVQPSPALTSAISATIRSSFALGIELDQVLFVNQIAFASGEFDFVGYSLSDGSNIQAEYLCFGNGTCMHLVTNVVQIGTGNAPKNQSGFVNSGSNGNAPITTNSGSSAGVSSSSGGGYSGLFGGAISIAPAITYSTLSPEQVKSDPYLIPIYNALMPKLPQSLTSLQVRSIEKGTFSNGTIGYQVYYGSTTVSTHFLTIFFDPSKSQVIYLTLTNITASGSSSTGTSSSSFSSSSSTASYYSASPSQPSVGSGSATSNQVLMRQIFTSWALKQHPELGSAQPSGIEIQTTSGSAICTLYFTNVQERKYRVQLSMNLGTNEIREVQFVRCS